MSLRRLNHISSWHFLWTHKSASHLTILCSLPVSSSIWRMFGRARVLRVRTKVQRLEHAIISPLDLFSTTPTMQWMNAVDAAAESYYDPSSLSPALLLFSLLLFLGCRPRNSFQSDDQLIFKNRFLKFFLSFSFTLFRFGRIQFFSALLHLLDSFSQTVFRFSVQYFLAAFICVVDFLWNSLRMWVASSERSIV